MPFILCVKSLINSYHMVILQIYMHNLSKALDKVNHYTCTLFVKFMERRTCIPVCILSMIENLFSDCRAGVK